MEIRVVSGQPRVAAVSELPALLADFDGLIWIDIPHFDDESAELLRTQFGFHPVAVHECKIRQSMPKFHPYGDYVFVVTHAPQFGAHGHVHYVEMDQFVAERYLVTVHGPLNPAVPEWAALRDVDLIWERITEGRFHPRTGLELSHAIVGSAIRGMEETLATVTESVWKLEQTVSAGAMGDPERFLDLMFRTRHGLLAIANISRTAVEIYERMSTVTHWLDDHGRELLADTVDQLHRVCHLADAQRAYLQGVIDFYRTRTDTKMTIAAERLAVIAVVTLPITALASVLGMNVIVNAQTDPEWLSGMLAAMLIMSLILLRWAKKQGWW